MVLVQGFQPKRQASPQHNSQTQEILGELVALYSDAKDAARERSYVANENMAFYRGLQWGTVTELGYWPDTEDTGESMEAYNYVRPTVRSAVASMIRNMPNPEAVATKSDQSSMTRALAVQHLLRSITKNGTVPIETIYRGETEAGARGAVWYKVYFDPNAGKFVDVPRTREIPTEPFHDIDMDPATGLPAMDRRAEGAIRVEFRSIIDVLPDPNATTEEESWRIIDRKLVSVATLDDHFPTDAFGEPTEGRWSNQDTDNAPRERDMIEGSRFYASTYTSSMRSPGNLLCEVVEFWEKPTRKYPRGRLVVWCGDVIIALSDLPYWPWILRNGQNIVPNAIYADGVVSDLKPMQRTINLNASKKREWVDKILSPPLLNPSDSGIARDHFTDIAGEIINYNAPLKPEWMAVPSIPAAMFNLEESLVSIIKDVSTYSDISRGDAPAGVETGRALAYLHEFSQGVREPDVAMFKEAMVRILKACLELMRDYFTEERLIQVLGENNKWMMKPFRRQDYDFDAEVVIELDSGAPSSRALRMAEAIQLFQVGAYADTPEAARLRRVLNIDFQDRNTVDPLDKHRLRARELLQAIVDDPTIDLVALEQEDHEVFLEIFDDFRVSTEYFSLPPFAQATVDDYVMQHEEMLAMQQQNFAQQQGMLAPPKKGGSPEKRPEMASPFDGGQSDIAGAAQPGASPDIEQPITAAA